MFRKLPITIIGYVRLGVLKVCSVAVEASTPEANAKASPHESEAMLSQNMTAMSTLTFVSLFVSLFFYNFKVDVHCD